MKKTTFFHHSGPEYVNIELIWEYNDLTRLKQIIKMQLI